MEDRKTTRSPWTNVAFAVGGIAALAFVVWSEWSRWQDLQNAGQGIGVWLSDMQLDSTPFAVLFLLLPIFLLIRTPIIRLPHRILRLAGNWFGPQTKPEN